MATIITLNDGVDTIIIYSSFIPTAQKYIERVKSLSGGEIVSITCLLNEFKNNY